ncbi:MAG: MarR family winged helix-turn-helix transcriptional regulator [Kiritimatiellae bacterium]|nr:MarR family winged helix-turn-helix transcriptional regulator [Kiritimatiellia bacterium]
MKENTSATHTWLILFKAWRAVEAWDKQSIASMGLSFTDFIVMEALLHKGEMPVNELGRKVYLTSGSITTAVSRLEKQAYVKRTVAKKDARVVMVSLSASGRRYIQRVFARHSANLEKAFSVLSSTERARLLPALRKLGRHADEMRLQKA